MYAHCSMLSHIQKSDQFINKQKQDKKVPVGNIYLDLGV